MSVLLIVCAAVATAGSLIFGIVWVSIKLADKNVGFGAASWNDSGRGNSDGYGNGSHSSTFGGDAGCGGGD